MLQVQPTDDGVRDQLDRTTSELSAIRHGLVDVGTGTVVTIRLPLVTGDAGQERIMSADDPELHAGPSTSLTPTH